ncbi:uncharacterized protein KY384_003006 [Bacidia gigantensis]|uniref:uncharacterized protein n=1 Tax=Bacidia gigantensis TaxID=2732470 RepID=UPI001D04F02B|nr:uncharacterized protein KY384_003006 [Bacidia gigantensis]KAG8531377.1 hypothetical protein KY384_003006 [Bacidia gigantensis]
MLGAFRTSSPLYGGLLWKIPWRLSPPRKRRQRKRLKLVDRVVSTVASALQRNKITEPEQLQRWKAEMPTQEEMKPKDKYTIFDRKVKGYRKGVHSEYGPFLVLLLGTAVKTGDIKSLVIGMGGRAGEWVKIWSRG